MPEGMPTNPQQIFAQQAKGSLPGKVGKVLNEGANFFTGLSFNPKTGGLKVSPSVVFYLAPHAYGGAVPNSAYGLPDYQPLFALPALLFTPSGTREHRRGVELERRGVREDSNRRLAADARNLADVQLVQNLSAATDPFNQTPAAKTSARILAGEVIARGIDPNQVFANPVFGQRVTVGDLVARVPNPIPPEGLPRGIAALALHQLSNAATVLIPPEQHQEGAELQALQVTNPPDP